jgi:hypothetical protein
MLPTAAWRRRQQHRNAAWPPPLPGHLALDQLAAWAI